MNYELINGNTLRAILDEIISPKMHEHGMKWNGNNLWFDSSVNSIRRVFQYSHLKGGQGTFTWGVCIDFIPTISSNKLKFHKTDKSVYMHLFEWTDEYLNSELEGGITSHWGVHAAQSSISLLLSKYEKRIFNWFQNADTLDKIIDIAKFQIETGKIYSHHYPDPKLILAFLQAKTNQPEAAIKTVNQLALEDHFKELLLNQLNKTK